MGDQLTLRPPGPRQWGPNFPRPTTAAPTSHAGHSWVCGNWHKRPPMTSLAGILIDRYASIVCVSVVRGAAHTFPSRTDRYCATPYTAAVDCDGDTGRDPRAYL
ncbi:hypothetical protein Q1695_010611 [Nippostrongylus brasiliensis]|nr:hypothetical protein Q1695_010611 [Nippostrongylus brasiliensis]